MGFLVLMMWKKVSELKFLINVESDFLTVETSGSWKESDWGVIEISFETGFLTIRKNSEISNLVILLSEEPYILFFNLAR